MQLALEGKADKIDFGETINNALYAGLIGGLTSMLQTGVEIATFKTGDIGLFVDGVKVPKAKAMSLLEQAKANSKNFKALDDLRSKNN